MMHRILIVENDPRWYQMLEEVSANLGYSTCRAARAREALDVVEKDDIALILLDIKLPSIHGHFLLRKLRKDKLMVPIIVVAGYLTPEVVETLIDGRVQEIIVKSEFRVRRLAEAMSSAIDGV